jgi:hypothetical protein
MLVLESWVWSPLKSASNSVARTYWRENSRVVTMSENGPKFRRIPDGVRVY